MLIIRLIRSPMAIFLLAVAIAYWLAFLGIAAALAVERPAEYRLRWSDEFPGTCLRRPRPFASQPPRRSMRTARGNTFTLTAFDIDQA